MQGLGSTGAGTAGPGPHESGPPGPRLHVAIIMDGNGRWARARGLPRAEGHRAGAHTVRQVVSTAPRLGISTLTLYAFSSDNWRRPPMEVRHLMRLLGSHLRSEARRCVEQGVRVSVIGRRDRLDPGLMATIGSVEDRTRNGTRLRLQLAIDYSARDAMLEAARRSWMGPDVIPLRAPGMDPGTLSREEFARLMARALHTDQSIPDVDLLIRTGGEQRLSDFLLWECAYAELVFTPRPWPDFGADDLALTLEEFRGRDRRYGGLPTPPVQEVSHG